MFKKMHVVLIALILVVSISQGFRYFFASPAHGQSAAVLFDASFLNENGENKNLNNYTGKIIVLNFWATWCEPCRDEMPELSALHNEYQDKNVVVLGLAIDDVAAIKAFSATTKVSYPIFAAEGIGMELASTLGNNKGVLPYTVIIKADGHIANHYFGRVSKPLLEKTLNTLVQK